MDHKPDDTTNATTEEPKVLGLLAEFETADEIVAAARKAREEGYEHIDAHTPYPIHALDDALKIKPTIIPWLVLGAGLTGTTIAVLMQWWTNAVDYQFLISNKPLFGLPAAVPIMFELTVLLAAITAFMSVMVLNKLVQPSNPLFQNERFRRATIDRFFLYVEARGYKFDNDETNGFLSSLGARAVEPIVETEAERATQIPRPIIVGLIILVSIAAVPVFAVARMRVGTFDKPRLHLIPDMDHQAKYKAQTENADFADGRSNRLPPEGTVRFGDLRDNYELYVGKKANGDWVEDFPLPVTDELMARGMQRYNITCAACHGASGAGDGLVARRADRLEEGTWVIPKAVYDTEVIPQPIGQLFDSITNGVRNMPAYGSQITVEDRWAIVLYVKALQRARVANADDVPADVKESLR